MAYVSYNGYLQRVEQVYKFYDAPRGMVFIAYGRLVKPNGRYANAPTVSLYRMQDRNWDYHFVAVE